MSKTRPRILSAPKPPKPLYTYGKDKIISKQHYDELVDLIEELSSFFPCCLNCEGKTVIGERTDKCVYAIGRTPDDILYCADRGIKNILDIQKENKMLKEQLQKENNNIEDTVKQVSDLIYKELDEQHCDTCRYNEEYQETDWRFCDECQGGDGWNIARHATDEIARKIVELMEK